MNEQRKRQLIFLCLCVIFVAATNGFSVAERSEVNALPSEDEPNQTDSNMNISPEVLKQVMWKRCSNSSYFICAKLALVHIVEKLDSADNYPLMPGISLQRYTASAAAATATNDLSLGKDFSEALDKYLVTKIKRYLGSLTLSVKLLDRNTVEDVRSFGEMIIGSPSVAEGRGKKKYMQALLMAGWMSGATLLALTMKTIAVLSGKALLAALLSLMFSIISTFSKGHAETKSTTYEIITKPIVAHSHTADIHEAHPSEHSIGLPYRRSISLDNLLPSSYKTPRFLGTKEANLPEVDSVDDVMYSMSQQGKSPVYVHSEYYTDM